MAMTQAEYARHRGVTRQAISKIVGKLPDSAFVIEAGRRLIDPAAADYALGEVRERILSGDDDAVPGRSGAGVADPTFGSNAGANRGGQGGEGVARLTQARTASEIYRAKIAELDYEARVGRLLAIEDVTRAMERCAAVIVRELEQLPNFADDLAAAMSRDGVQGVRLALKDIVRGVRSALEKNMQLAAAEDHAAKQEEAASS